MDAMSESWQERYAEKIVDPGEAVKQIRAGQNLFLGTACATPRVLIEAFEALEQPPPDVHIYHFLTSGTAGDGQEIFSSKYHHRVFFVGSDVRAMVADGGADYIPIGLSEVPRLLDNGRIGIDCAFIQTSEPDANGYVSLGVSVDITMAVVRHAKKIVAEINPRMPRTLGDTFLHVDQITYLVPVDSAIIEYKHNAPDEVVKQIARYIAGIIEDGSTLQVGLGRIPNEAFRYLTDRRNLGIHSDVITDGIIDLVRKGVISGSEKSMYRGQIVASYCMGNEDLYRLIHNNPMFRFLPIERVCDPHVIARNRRMVSITQAFSVDLTGQVCVDQFGGEFYGGVSTQPDFLRGAARSSGGKPIICLTSVTDDGKTSRIRPLLQIGEGVGIARSDVHYVVTEYGIAYLFGKSIRERALALIEIAHPDFRAELLDEARRLGYVHAEQKMASCAPYPIDLERLVTLKDGRTVRLRPTRASDARALQSLFHSLSQEDVYTRFFRRLRSLSYSEAQSLCNVNYDSEVAFLAVTGPREHEVVVGSSCYFVNPSTNIAEVAFMIASEWQGTGLGKALQQRMKEEAVSRGLLGFCAEILANNTKMLKLAKGACDQVTVERDDNSFHVTMMF